MSISTSKEKNLRVITKDGIDFYIDNLNILHSVYSCSIEKKEKIVVPEGVEKIGNGTFMEHRNLKEVVLPKSLKFIGKAAFFSCESLEKIYIPYGVEVIGDRAFIGCEKLKNLILPISIKEIGSHSFFGCTSLNMVVVPPNVTKVRDSTFDEIGKLTLFIPSCAKTIDDTDFINTSILKQTYSTVLLYDFIGGLRKDLTGVFEENKIWNIISQEIYDYFKLR